MSDLPDRNELPSLGPRTRAVLPTRRRNVRQKVRVGGHTCYIDCGLYDDGRPGELFLDLSKQGAALRFWASGTCRACGNCVPTYRGVDGVRRCRSHRLNNGKEWWCCLGSGATRKEDLPAKE